MLEYIVRAETNSPQYDDVNVILAPDEPSGALFSDIYPHSSYNMSIRGRNTAGWSPYDDMVIPRANDGESCRCYVTYHIILIG